ncbi:MAG: hypothetical protein QOH27_3201, partial [Mycobacterium sp.]|nr:hypothetical protein [Mycobacterium sp.]
ATALRSELSKQHPAVRYRLLLTGLAELPAV